MKTSLGKIINIFTVAILSACGVILYFNVSNAIKKSRRFTATCLEVEKKFLNAYPRQFDWGIPCHVQVPQLVEVVEDISENESLRKEAVEELNRIKQELIRLKDSVGMQPINEEQHLRIKSFVLKAEEIVDLEIAHLINDPYLLQMKRTLSAKE